MIRTSVGPLLFALSGLIIWAAQFLTTYVFAALACARGWVSPDLLGTEGTRAVLVALSAVAVLAALAVLARGVTQARHAARVPDEPTPITAWLAAAGAAIAVLAIVWGTLPVLVVPLCPA